MQARSGGGGAPLRSQSLVRVVAGTCITTVPRPSSDGVASDGVCVAHIRRPS